MGNRLREYSSAVQTEVEDIPPTVPETIIVTRVNEETYRRARGTTSSPDVPVEGSNNRAGWRFVMWALPILLVLFGTDYVRRFLFATIAAVCTLWAIWKLLDSAYRSHDRVVLAISLYLAALLLAFELAFVIIRTKFT